MSRIQILTLFCVISTVVGSHAQSREDFYGVTPVRAVMESGFWPGFLERQIERLGDSVGIALPKIHTFEQLNREALAKVYLPMIREAFSYPHLIARPEDRKPDVTLLLLRSLPKDDWGDDLKKDAADLISFLETGGPERPERK